MCLTNQRGTAERAYCIHAGGRKPKPTREVVCGVRLFCWERARSRAVNIRTTKKSPYTNSNGPGRTHIGAVGGSVLWDGWRLHPRSTWSSTSSQEPLQLPIRTAGTLPHGTK